MMFLHKKVSSASAPSDPEKIGGPDWNEAHALANGASLITAVGVFSISASAASFIGNDAVADGAGTWVMDGVDFGHSEFVGNCIDGYATGYLMLSVLGGLPAGWRITVNVDSTPAPADSPPMVVVTVIDDTDQPANPPGLIVGQCFWVATSAPMPS
jgi:hypothetical protein